MTVMRYVKSNVHRVVDFERDYSRRSSVESMTLKDYDPVPPGTIIGIDLVSDFVCEMCYSLAQVEGHHRDDPQRVQDGHYCGSDGANEVVEFSNSNVNIRKSRLLSAAGITWTLGTVVE